MVDPGFELSAQTSNNEPWGLDTDRKEPSSTGADRNEGLSLFLAAPHPVPHFSSPPRRLVKGARVNPEPHERYALPWELALHSGMPSHRNVSKSQFDPVSSARSHSLILSAASQWLRRRDTTPIFHGFIAHKPRPASHLPQRPPKRLHSGMGPRGSLATLLISSERLKGETHKGIRYE